MKQWVTTVFLALATAGVMAQEGPKGLAENTKAPGFRAKDNNGKGFSLTKELRKGPVVLLFYRGNWCPFCNKQLMQLNDSLQLITAKGAQVIAITPENGEGVSKTVSKTKAGFAIVSDKDMAIMKKYDVAFAMDDKTKEKYKGYGIDLEQNNGSNGWNLPVPAVYIIGKNGMISWRYFNTDYSKRPTVAEIVSHL